MWIHIIRDSYSSHSIHLIYLGKPLRPVLSVKTIVIDLENHIIHNVLLTCEYILISNGESKFL